MGTTTSPRRLKNVLWYRLTTNKTQQQIAEELNLSKAAVHRALRDQIPALDPHELRELLAGISQRSLDQERLNS